MAPKKPMDVGGGPVPGQNHSCKEMKWMLFVDMECGTDSQSYYYCTKVFYTGKCPARRDPEETSNNAHHEASVCRLTNVSSGLDSIMLSLPTLMPGYNEQKCLDFCFWRLAQ